MMDVQFIVRWNDGGKGGSATFESHGTCKGFAQDIECDCDLIDGPHFVKKCAGKKERCVQEAQNLVDVDFDEIWGYDVRDVSESDSAGDAEVIKAEDVL